MNETQPQIHSALSAVIGELPGIGKDSTGKGLQYNYRGIEDIVPVVKRLFAENGIHMTANHSIVADADKQGNSGKQRRVVLQSTFMFYAADGSFVSTTTVGEAMDVQDKAMNKAMTAAYKYALIQTLCIADGDDPDAYQPNQPNQQAAAPEPTESWKALVALGDQLKANSVSDQVKEWAKENGFNIGDRASDVTPVVKYAQSLLDSIGGDGAAERVAETFGGEIEEAEVVDG